MEFKWKTLNDLIQASTPKDADLLMVHDGTNLKKITLQKIKEFITNGLAQKSYVDSQDTAISSRVTENTNNVTKLRSDVDTLLPLGLKVENGVVMDYWMED